MNRIKIIKKNGNAVELQSPINTDATVPESNFEPRDATETIEGWITNWRRRKETETSRAFDELTRLGLKSSV